jgi:hypothetical protein
VASRDTTKKISLLAFTIAIAFIVFWAAGCGSDLTPAEKNAKRILDNCIQKTETIKTVEVTGTIKASQSDGRYADRTSSGVFAKTDTGEPISKFEISGRVITGVDENVTHYYFKGYDYFNTGNGWKKTAALSPLSLTWVVKNATNFRIVSSDSNSIKIACDINPAALWKSQGVRIQPGTALSRSVENARISDVFEVNKNGSPLESYSSVWRLLNPTSKGNLPLTVTTACHYSGYGSPVTFQVPPEALGARMYDIFHPYPSVNGYGLQPL